MSESSTEAVFPAPSGTENPTERQLIEQFLNSKRNVENLTDTLKEATRERDDIEAKLIKILQDEGKQATARYEGLGHIIVCTGAAHASIQKGMSDEVKSHLRNIGRDDLIKETIAPASLSSYVRECLSQNIEIPNGVSFYVPQFLKFYASK